MERQAGVLFRVRFSHQTRQNHDCREQQQVRQQQVRLTNTLLKQRSTDRVQRTRNAFAAGRSFAVVRT